MAKNRFTIAIIDEEIKERNKIYNFFEDDFDIIEIKKLSSIDELIEIIKSEKVDAVAIDYKLKEHNTRFNENGDLIFRKLIDSFVNFPAFILTNDSLKAKKESKKINPLFILDKAKLHDEAGKRDFINEIYSLITVYKTDLKEKIARLKTLTALKNRNKLAQKDENEFLELNSQISKSIAGFDAVPMNFFAKKTDDKLDEVLAKTDELIKKIEKQMKKK